MTAAEKQQLYVFLKKTDDWLHGYGTPDFCAGKTFADDEAFVPAAAADSGSDIFLSKNSESFALTETQAVQVAAVPAATLESIAAKILRCSNCPLCCGRNHAVPGEGVPQPTVMVIGEGPGEDEDKTGRPFVGRAGQLLDKMLAAIGLDRGCNCYIANIVKCRPPQNRTPLPEEAAACSGFLEAQIHLLRPKMILAMGRTAAQNLLHTSQGINALRGKFFAYQNIPLLATYHPSALLRNAELKRPAWEDLKVFRARLEELCPGYDASFAAQRRSGQ